MEYKGKVKGTIVGEWRGSRAIEGMESRKRRFMEGEWKHAKGGRVGEEKYARGRFFLYLFVTLIDF